MGFTYTKGGTGDKDRTRLQIQDVFEDRPLFDDAEIEDFLAIEGGVNGAVALAAETLVARFSRDFDFTADGSSFRKSTVVMNYERLARRFRAKDRGVAVRVPTRVDGYSSDIDSDEVGGIRR